MKLKEIDEKIAELQKLRKKTIQNQEAQRRFQAKKKEEKMNKFTLEMKAEGDGRICEGTSLQEMLAEIKHQIKMNLFEKDDIYVIRKNDEIIAEYDYEQAKKI